MLAPGTRLSHYSVLRLLGAGGMGEVYEAEDLRLKRRVAIKLLPENIASDAGRLARFEHEAQAIAALNHPNIVTIHSVEEDAGRRFLTMELVEGSTLDRLIPPGGLALPTLLDSAVPLVAAVAAAHARGIVHRDLKPANVMVCGDGRIKVLDFGLAKLDPIGASDDAETRTGSQVGTAAGQIVGTPAYMSPEQADGRPVDTRSDVFSLGILLYEMASGLRPFRGESSLSVLSSILRDDPEPLSRVRRDLPPAYREIVTRCLSKDPVQRPSAADIADGLARIGMAPVTPAASRGRSPARPRRT